MYIGELGAQSKFDSVNFCFSLICVYHRKYIIFHTYTRPLYINVLKTLSLPINPNMISVVDIENSHDQGHWKSL